MNKYIHNVVWFAVDKMFVLFGGLVATIVVARYLGPETLGQITFGIAVSGLFIAIGQWGANHVIFDNAVKFKSATLKLIASTERIRLILYLIPWFVFTIIISNIDKYSENAFIISLSSLSGLFLSLDVHQFYHNANLDSKKNAVSNAVAKITSILLRLLFVLFQLKGIFFIIPYFINNFLLFFLRKQPSNVGSKSKRYKNWFIVKGKFFTVSAAITFAYLKVNEILLSYFVSYEDLAYYSMGLAIAFSWTFFPLSFGSGLFTLATGSKYYKYRDDIFSVIIFFMMVFSLPIISTISFFSEEIVGIVLGADYQKTGAILSLLCLSTFLSTLNVITSRIIGFYNGGWYLAKKIVAVSVFNIPLTIYLVSELGLSGAVWSIFISEITSLTIFNYNFKKGLILSIHLKSFNLFHSVRTVKEILNIKKDTE